jgi:hypothetical protein
MNREITNCIREPILKSCSFCLLPPSDSECHCAKMYHGHMWCMPPKFQKLNIRFSVICFKAIVQILAEIFTLSKGVRTLFDGCMCHWLLNYSFILRDLIWELYRYWLLHVNNLTCIKYVMFICSFLYVHDWMKTANGNHSFNA